MAYSIAIIEDEEGIRQYLQEVLLDEGYSVQAASTGVDGLKLLEKLQPDLLILDLGLPDITGETILNEVRKDYPDMAIIILTANDTVNSVVEGLELGADDYMTKPFTKEELFARIKARLRVKGEVDTVLRVADLELDTKTMEIRRGTELIHLTPQEYRLLEYLMSNKNQVLTREMILNRIWLYSTEVETRVVDVYMGYLRKKIDSEHQHKLIHSVRGFGYVIKE